LTAPRPGLSSGLRRLLLPLALVALVAVRPAAVQHLTASDLLVKAYKSLLNMDADRVARELADACGPAPPEACQLLRLTSDRWQIELDLQNRSLDARVLAGAEEAIQATEAWTKREPTRAEAWFYLGAAYGTRAQMHGIRLERLAAARDGKRIKNALERALALDPGLEDAHFGIGLYKYLAGVVPAPVRLLAWLLLLPGGDRVEGMREMLQARTHGALLGDEADYQMHWFYLWYENQPEKALALLEGLRGRFPHNPVFLWRIAEVQDVYFHDRPAARNTYRALVTAAEAGQVAAIPLALTRGRLGLGEQLGELGDSDRAVEMLEPVITARASAPYGALARAWYLTGLAQDRLGHRDQAIRAYQAAAAAVPAGDPDNLGGLARARLGRTPEARLSDAYRLSLEGWRALERGALSDAATALDRAMTLNPADATTRYRLGRLYLARGEAKGARSEFEAVIAAQPAAPPWILAAAYLEAARLVDREGDRARAITMYRAAATMSGSEPETRESAAAALARAGVPKGAPHD
jgi:tetratricopeptide (TPR) repeat protein